jgi:hypothetical protein
VEYAPAPSNRRCRLGSWLGCYSLGMGLVDGKCKTKRAKVGLFVGPLAKDGQDQPKIRPIVRAQVVVVVV